MTQEEALQILQKAGTAQTQKTYRRHGAPEHVLGVNFSVLRPLAKQLKNRTDLARELWVTTVPEARLLAYQIANPRDLTDKELEQWVRQLSWYCEADLFGAMVAKSPLAEKKIASWTHSKNEWISRAGWDVLAHLALSADDRPDAFFEEALERVQKTIHQAPNYTRHAMNGAVIAIGVRNENLKAKAITTARTIGKVVVDHGETACKTPDAESYILKTLAYRQKKQKAPDRKANKAHHS